MTTTTLSAARQAMSENMGDFLSFDTTAAGDAAGFTIVSTALLNQVGGTDSDSFEGWYALINDTDSSADGEVKRVESYLDDPDNPTLRVQSAFSVQIDSGITVELHRFNPTDKDNVIRQSISELFSDLYLPIRDESLIIDNVLSNSGFETFASSVFTGWTIVGSPTLTQETTIVKHGSSSAKIVSSASAAGQLTQAPDININEVTNETAKFELWVYATEPNVARLRIDFGSGFSNSSFHSGKDQWELLCTESGVPDAATQIKAICESAISGTSYFDIGYLDLGPIYEYTLPSTIITGPHRVSQQYNMDNTDNPFYPMADGGTSMSTPRPMRGHILRVEGYGVLSRPTTNSGTIEVGEPQIRLIVAYSEMLMWRLMASPARSSKQDREGYIQAGSDAASKVAFLKSQHGMKTPRIGVHRHRQSWHVESNSSDKLLVFPRNRGR
jgi:hypothetical protein